MMIPPRAADIARSVAVLVTPQIADELCAAGSQASEDGIDVVNGERDVADTRGVRRRALVATVG